MDVAISGSSGLIGTALVTALTAAGHRPVRLVRREPAGDEIRWDPDGGSIDAQSLEGIGGVVHLAGAGIGDHRWTDEYKLEILRSRTKSTVLLAGALADLGKPPSVLLSGSAIGFYGDREDELLDEASPAGTGFLPEVCVAWEAATVAAEEAGIRVAHLRTGIVLSGEGGALKKQLPLFKVGAGGKLGSGRQWQSWIALDDEIAAILHLIASDLAGPVNLTAPTPVTNAELTKTLGSVLHRPTVVPVPSFGPKLLLGPELASVVLYEGQRVMPEVLLASGFTFSQPTLEGALRSMLDHT